MDDPMPTEPPMAALDYATPELTGESPWAVRVAWTAIGVLWTGWACIGIITAESALVSGPVLATVAAVMGVLAARSRHWPFCIIAIGHLCLCGVLIAIVNVFNLSPRRSVVPFLMIGTVWGVIATAATAFHRSLNFIRIVRTQSGLTLHVPFSLRR